MVSGFLLSGDGIKMRFHGNGRTEQLNGTDFDPFSDWAIGQSMLDTCQAFNRRFCAI
jgi:hypothetical protein